MLRLPSGWLQQLLDDTKSKKAHNEQAAYMFGFKWCFLYTSSTDDLLCYPAVALASSL